MNEGVDDILKRLGVVESSVSEMRERLGGIAATMPSLATKDDLSQVKVQLSAIAATMPSFATKDDLSKVKEQVSTIAATIPHLATKADIAAVNGSISALETKMIKWLFAQALTIVGLVFSIIKFVH